MIEIESLFNMTSSSDQSGLQVFPGLTKTTFYVQVVIGFTFSLFQVAIHAIGDKANDLILDMYESVVSTNGMRDRRFRVNVVAKT